MKTPTLVYRLSHWFNVPATLLVAFLQRAPALRLVTNVVDPLLASPAGSVLRSAAAAAVSLGALHALSGATQFVQNPGNPVHGTVGQPLSVGFTIVGSPLPPAFFIVNGALPPGLHTIPAMSGNRIPSGTPVITGTPTQAGNFSVSITGSDGTFSENDEIIFDIAGGITTTPPAFTTQPLASQTVAVGASVTFSVAVSGSPTPVLQWRKNGASIADATDTTLTLANVQSSDAGNYSVVATNSAGSITSSDAMLVVNPVVNVAPAITVQPAGQMVADGSTVVFSVGATNATSFHWQHNGAAIPGATRSVLVIKGASTGDAGDYACVVTGGGGSVTSSAAGLSFSNDPDFGHLINLSILTNITASASQFTMGTVVGGAGTSGGKPLLVRAVGPSLVQFGVPNAITDPVINLLSEGTVLGTNNDWGGAAPITAASAQVGAFPFVASTSKDAAIVDANAGAGKYSLQIGGAGGATGPVLAELYDATSGASFGASTPRLVNVSVLKRLDSNETLTAGFVIGGSTNRTVLVRAVGPALIPFGVGDAMADPRLSLFADSSLLATNDNWGGDAQLNAVCDAVGAFSITDPASKDAMLVITLPPGKYSAQVNGGGAAGSALVEVYEVP